MFISYDGKVIKDITDRNILYCGRTPECSKLSTLLEVYEQAERDALGDQAAAVLFLHYNKKVGAIRGPSKCFKITTADDIEMFKAIVTQKNK